MSALPWCGDRLWITAQSVTRNGAGRSKDESHRREDEVLCLGFINWGRTVCAKASLSEKCTIL